jgi:5-methyltetrahydrofolate--homocysteine methyltransferase
METRVRSAVKEVIIGPGRPFVIIGERINPTGRKSLGREMAAGNFDRVRADALAQVAAGAQMLDVNAGIPMADEPAILAEAVRVVQSVVDAPLALDSSIVAALAAGLKAYRGKALVNSVTGETDRLEAVLPLVAEYGAAVIGVANDESGISNDPDVRFAVAQKIVARAEAYGIPREDVVIDPLAMPVGAVPGAGAAFFSLARRIREELGVNMTCGASNVSFGLPGRPSLNAAFIAMAMSAGLTCAITNPLEPEVYKAILAADVFMGHDANCQGWIAHHKPAPSEEAGPTRRARRARTDNQT